MSANGEADRIDSATAWWLLLGASLVTAVVYAVIAAMGPQYSLDVPVVARPLLQVIGLYFAAFVAYWLAWFAATRVESKKWLVVWLLGTSLLWRAILLPTPPFQEIDIYRYLWDGAATSHGWDPYAYPPGEVVAAIDAAAAGRSLEATPRLSEMVRFATVEAPEYASILRTIHYGELPSPYPPVSQAVFAAASATSPFETATGHLAWLKLWLAGFDFATLLLVLCMLRQAGGHLGHAVAYGWCPLVLKEVAGSGHLDSIATFFAVLAMALAMRSLSGDGNPWRWVLGAATAIAFGVGAKLFPIILAPLLTVVWLRRIGWRHALGGAGLIAAGSALLLAPMLMRNPDAPPRLPATAQTETGALPPPPDEPSTTTKTAGLAAFLQKWEINDLIFLVVVENLRTQSGVAPEHRPWFVTVPEHTSATVVDAWRNAASRLVPGAAEWDDLQASFLLARTITLLVFAGVAIGCAWRASQPGRANADLACAAFLTLAWFWLLAPTQNPWYWCWAVPLLPFAKNRTWAALAACCLLYYTWRWLQWHYPEPPVFGTRYNGSYYYFFVVVWFEFGPWYAALAIESLRRWWRQRELA